MIEILSNYLRVDLVILTVESCFMKKELDAVPGTNIVYQDKRNNLFYSTKVATRRARAVVIAIGSYVANIILY